MNQITSSLAAAAFLLAGAAALQADIVRFVGARKPIVDVKISSESLKAIVWQKADGGTESVRPWEVESYRLDRNVANTEKYQDAVNSAVSAGVQGNAKNLAAAATKALETKAPAVYPNIDFLLMRLRYYKLRALAEMQRGPEEVEAALAEFNDANKKYAEALAKDRANTAGTVMEKGTWKGLFAVTLHSFTIDAYLAVAEWHRAAGRTEDAWTKGYQPAADLAEECYAAQGRTIADYLTRWAIPALRRGAAMFMEPDKEKKVKWDKAEAAFTQIARLAAAAREDSLAKWAQMREARCKLNSGDKNKEDAARRTYDDALAAFRRSRDSGGPGTPGYRALTPELASVYAEAANGLGYIAEKKKNDVEALRQFSLSLTFFSANAEARAEALFQAGLTLVRIGTATGVSKTAKESHKRTADAYLNELRMVLGETEFGKRVSELSEAVNKLG